MVSVYIFDIFSFHAMIDSAGLFFFFFNVHKVSV